MKVLITVSAVLILILIAIGGYIFLRGTQAPAPAQDLSVSFPSSGSTGTVMNDQLTDRTVESADGTPLLVKDFISNGVTYKDPANDGSYYLAGTLGYCLEDGTCPDTGTPHFSILYLSEGETFIISLDEEPLGTSRLEAEAYLRRTLGITNEQMCSLDYTVGTTVYVNSVFGSMNTLGFSFCPNAVTLPA